MKKIHLGHLFVGLCVLALGVDIGLAIRDALASRNSSGTMSAINGPYAAPNVISSSVINARFADIETEITDSLDRSGKGPMLAPLRLTNGTFAAPSLTFDSDTDTGIYRIGANNLGVTANGAKVLDVATTGLSVTGTGTFSQGLVSPIGIGNTSTVYPLDVTAINGFDNARFGDKLVLAGTGPFLGFNFHNDGSGNKYLTTNPAGELSFDTSAGAFILYTAPSGTAAAAATLTERMRLSPSGLTIGASGTAISASYRGTTSWTPGSISANACVTTTVTVTGAAAGADCVVTMPSGTPVASVWTSCSVTLNTCNLYQCNADNVNAHTGDVGTYACRVFNP
jgi:hypothetical protein